MIVIKTVYSNELQRLVIVSMHCKFVLNEVDLFVRSFVVFPIYDRSKNVSMC